MNAQGWIAREQILGEEARARWGGAARGIPLLFEPSRVDQGACEPLRRLLPPDGCPCPLLALVFRDFHPQQPLDAQPLPRRVPDEFVRQSPDAANPPTFFLLLSEMSQRVAAASQVRPATARAVTPSSAFWAAGVCGPLRKRRKCADRPPTSTSRAGKRLGCDHSCGCSAPKGGLASFAVRCCRLLLASSVLFTVICQGRFCSLPVCAHFPVQMQLYPCANVRPVARPAAHGICGSTTPSQALCPGPTAGAGATPAAAASSTPRHSHRGWTMRRGRRTRRVSLRWGST